MLGPPHNAEEINFAITAQARNATALRPKLFYPGTVACSVGWERPCMSQCHIDSPVEHPFAQRQTQLHITTHMTQ